MKNTFCVLRVQESTLGKKFPTCDYRRYGDANGTGLGFCGSPLNCPYKKVIEISEERLEKAVQNGEDVIQLTETM